MQRAIAGALMSLSFFAAAAAQLPPEILVERYLLRAGRLMESKDPKGALEVMSKIVSLQKEHGLRLPDGFHFKHARVALSAGSIGEAINASNVYLVEIGREGKFYREALELLQEAERMEQLQSWFGAEKMCAGQPKGTSCWMEVTGQPDCHVWNHNLQPDEIVTWSGKCAEGRADGEGTTRWVYDGGKKTLVATDVSWTERCTVNGSCAGRTGKLRKACTWTGRGGAGGSFAMRTETLRKAPM